MKERKFNDGDTEKCPECGSELLYWHMPDWEEGEQILGSISCEDCSARWAVSFKPYWTTIYAD